MRRLSRADSMKEDEKPSEQLESEIRDIYRETDFDGPDAIDWTLLNKCICSLRNLKEFNTPIYDDEKFIRCLETKHVKPSNVIIIEGHLIFCNEILKDYMNLTLILYRYEGLGVKEIRAFLDEYHPEVYDYLPEP